ncbi:MAG: CBS domain-containing protein [Lysobacterales bacterium]|nr:MAG: CBS domain-containing protein [Xanthomonadales bacterium]
MSRSMLVKDHMVTNVITLDPDMEILGATQVLIRHDISGAPVLDKHGRLIGMLTERDCMRVTLHAGYHGAPGGLVRDYMSPAPVSVSPEDTILEVAERFINERYRRYPVLDGGRLVGVISRREVMRAMGHHYPT